MNSIAKSVYIVGLLSVSLAASVFIIVESGDFYQKLYHSHFSKFYLGYWVAALNEAFMAIMAGVWISRKDKKGATKDHPINYFFKFLMVLLFVTAVGGASLKAIQPNLAKIHQQENDNKIIQIIKSQIDDNNRSLKTFVLQKQRTNSALSVKQQIKSKEELKELLKSKTETSSLWIQVVFTIILRVGIQLANLSCVWIAGWMLRSPDIGPLFHSAPLEKPAVELHIESNSRKHLPSTQKEDKSLTNLSSVKSGKEHKSSSQPTKSPEDNPQIREDSKRNRINQLITQETLNVINITKSNSYVDSQDNTKQAGLREQIASLIKERNDGVSISDICTAVNIAEHRLMDIINLKRTLKNPDISELQNLLTRINILYSEGFASSF